MNRSSSMSTTKRVFLCRSLPALLLALGLAGCAATGDRDAASADPAPVYRGFIGEPVRSFDYSQLVDWRALDRDWVMVRVNRNRFFAIELRQPCVADAREPLGLQLLSGSPNRLTTADRILLRGRLCPIESIAPFDHAGWREAIVADR